MLLSYMKDCENSLKSLKCSPHQMHRERSGTMIGKLTLFHWNQVTWSWLKPMPTGEEESEGSVGGGIVWTGTPNHGWHPFLPCEDPANRMLMDPPLKSTFSHHSWQRGLISIWLCRLSGPSAPTPPSRNKLQRTVRLRKHHKVTNCLSLAQHQTGETPLGGGQETPCVHANISWSFLDR